MMLSYAKNLTMFQSSSIDSNHREIEEESTEPVEAVHNGNKVAVVEKAVSIQGERKSSGSGLGNRD
jgi:uncharacterized membrane-anchored protein